MKGRVVYVESSLNNEKEYYEKDDEDQEDNDDWGVDMTCLKELKNTYTQLEDKTKSLDRHIVKPFFDKVIAGIEENDEVYPTVELQHALDCLRTIDTEIYTEIQLQGFKDMKNTVGFENYISFFHPSLSI